MNLNQVTDTKPALTQKVWQKRCNVKAGLALENALNNTNYNQKFSTCFIGVA